MPKTEKQTKKEFLDKEALGKEIFGKNSGLDKEKFRKVSELYAQLAKLGVAPRGYRLNVRSLQTLEEAGSDEDSRTVYLTKACKGSY